MRWKLFIMEWKAGPDIFPEEFGESLYAPLVGNATYNDFFLSGQ